jgi:hypothetical protein
MVRGRPSGLKAACGTAARPACGRALTPEPLHPQAAGNQGQAQGLPPASAPHPAQPAPGYGEHGKGHLPALLQRPPEPAQYS